jgi:phage terminase small subunit
MALTPKQEAFCLSYIETGNASEAYRRSYDAGKMAPATINRKAKELLDNGKITARLNDLRSAASTRAEMTVAGHLDDLKELRELAKSEGKYSAAVAAEVARGKVSGFYIEKLEHSGEVKTPELRLILNGPRTTPATD